MARLSDVPKVLSTVGPFAFAKRVWARISEDNLFTWGSALAYSWLFAVFPFLLFLLSLYHYLPDTVQERARKELATFVYQLPKQAADAVWSNVEPNLESLERPKGLLALLSLGVALWAASGGMATTMAALDKCYDVTQGRPFYKQRPLAALLTIVVAVLIIAVVLLLPIGSLVKSLVIQTGIIGDRSIAWVVLFDALRWGLSLASMVTALAVLYHWGPSIRHKFHWLTPGAVFTIVVWVLLGLTFRLYIEKFGKYEQTYGTVGGVAILLLVFYVDALVLLIGAEINSEMDFEVLQVKRGTRDLRPAEELTENLPLTEPTPPDVAAEARAASEAADRAAEEKEKAEREAAAEKTVT
jgi:membrane protein